MIFNKLVNKSYFDKNGYVLLNTNLKGNLIFDKLCVEIEIPYDSQILDILNRNKILSKLSCGIIIYY